MPRDYAALPFNELYEMQAVEKDHPKWNVDEIYDYNQRKKRVEKLSRLKTAAVDGNIDAIPYGELQDFAVDEQGKNGLTAQKEVEAILNPDKAAAAEAMQGYLSELKKLEKLYDGNHAPKETQPPIAQTGATVQPLTQPLAVVEETATVPMYGSARTVDIGAGGNTGVTPTTPPGEGAADGAADGGNVEPPSGTETKDPQSTANGILSFSQWLDRFGVDADEQHQAALKLAYDEYARALSTYGRQAEQLAQAGLTNSGVSDNVQRAAYAQKQTALQNAQALKNQTEATNRSQYAAYVDTKEAQLEAQEKAEAEKTEAENESKELLQSEYNQLYYNLLKGYVDEDGKKYAPLSHEQAVASMKNLYGYTDEAMLAAAKESYDAVVQEDDNALQGMATPIAGGTTDAAGAAIAKDSLLDKLLTDTISPREFLEEVSDLTDIDYDDIDADADINIAVADVIDDLYERKLITKTQWQEHNYIHAQNAIKAASDNLVDDSVRKDLKAEDEGTLHTIITNAYQDYQEGKISKAAWDEYRSSILSGNGAIAVNVVEGTSGIEIEISVDGKKISRSFSAASPVPSGLHKKLNETANGASVVAYNGKIYKKVQILPAFQSVGQANKLQSYEGADNNMYWCEITERDKTVPASMYRILTMLLST